MCTSGMAFQWLSEKVHPFIQLLMSLEIKLNGKYICTVLLKQFIKIGLDVLYCPVGKVVLGSKPLHYIAQHHNEHAHNHT